MAGPAATKGIKYSLIIINVIVFLSGLIMLIGGSVVQGQINSESLSRSIAQYSTEAGSIICIVFGIFVLLLSVLGLFATVKDHYRFLFLYSAFISIILVIQFITGVFGLSVRNSSKFDDYVSDALSNDFTINSTNSAERDSIQAYFKCCGWNKYNDYIDPQSGQLEVPASCCKDKTNCIPDDKDGKLYFDKACSNKLITSFGTVIGTACTILVIFSLFNLASVILSVILGRSIKSGYQYT